MTRVALVGSAERVARSRAVLRDAPGIELAPTPDPTLGDVVVVAAETDDAMAAASSIGRQRPVVLVIDEGDTPAGLRAALEAGARGCVGPDADAFALRRAITSAGSFSSARSDGAADGAVGSLVAVVGGTGGAGTTTIALALARAADALLVDLDLAGGQLGDRLRPASASVGLAGGGDPRRLLDGLIEEIGDIRLARLAPAEDLAWTVPPGACGAVLREACRREKVVVVDAGRGSGPALEAITEADVIVVVAPAERTARGHAAAERFARLARPETRIVVVGSLGRRGGGFHHRVAAAAGRRGADIVVERVRAPEGEGQRRLVAALRPVLMHASAGPAP